jgi:isoleucyl-tRNA synthetase
VLLIWTTTPWTLVSNAAVAVDPTCRTCARPTATCWPRRSSSACSARRRRSPTASTAATCSAPATSRRSLHPGSEYGEKGHTVLPGDFVTADDGTGIVHTAIAFGEDDFRLGAEQGLNVINPVRPDGTYDERHRPYAGPLGQGGRPGPDRGPARARPAAARRGVPARLPALLALRHAAALLRQAVLVHPHRRSSATAAGRQRHRRLATRAHQDRPLRQVAGEQRRLGDLPRALLGHAAADLALRERARDRDRRVRRPEARAGRPLDDPHRPYVDDMTFDCEQCGSRCAACPR